MRYCTTALLVGMATTGNVAQVAVGFRAGIAAANMAMIEANDDMVQDLRLETVTFRAPTMAVVVDVPMGDHFSAVGEVGYAMRGYEIESKPFSVFRSERYVFDYADMTLLGKFRFLQEPTQPHLVLGGCFGKILGARTRLVDTDPQFPGIGTVLDPVKMNIGGWNAGLVGGIGLTFNIGGTWLFIEGRYNYGLTPIIDDLLFVDINGATIGEMHAYDRSFSGHIGWLIPLPSHGKEVIGGE